MDMTTAMSPCGLIQTEDILPKYGTAHWGEHFICSAVSFAYLTRCVWYSWYIMALVDVLEVIPDTHAAPLLTILDDLLPKIVEAADPDSGVW